MINRYLFKELNCRDAKKDLKEKQKGGKCNFANFRFIAEIKEITEIDKI